MGKVIFVCTIERGHTHAIANCLLLNVTDAMYWRANRPTQVEQGKTDYLVGLKCIFFCYSSGKSLWEVYVVGEIILSHSYIYFFEWNCGYGTSTCHCIIGSGMVFFALLQFTWTTDERKRNNRAEKGKNYRLWKRLGLLQHSFPNANAWQMLCLKYVNWVIPVEVIVSWIHGVAYFNPSGGIRAFVHFD